MPKGKYKKGGKGGQREDKKHERAVRRAMRRGKRLNESDPEFQSLSIQLTGQGLKMKDVPGDGNCLFRSLADQLILLRSDDITHQEMRSHIVSYMRSHGNDFSPFMEEDDMTYTDYLTDLSKDGTFGGNDTIVAFARLYNCSVVIHQPNTPRWEVHPEVGRATGSVAHVAYLHGDHYCSVRPLEEGDVPVIPDVIKDTKKISPKQPTTALHCSEISIDDTLENNNELNMLLAATGCENRGLAEKILLENGLDVSLAIIELLQLMSLQECTTDQLESSSNSLQSSNSDHSQVAPKVPSSDVMKRKPPKLNQPPPIQHHHLSNRERKEQAKRERKERRTEEKRKGASKKPSIDVISDSIGSLTI